MQNAESGLIGPYLHSSSGILHYCSHFSSTP
jgi:hypothetical protein